MEAGVLCVSCMATDVYDISSSQHVALSAQCKNCSCPLQYLWTVLEDNTTPLVLDSSDTSTGTDAANLVVLSRTALKDSHSYNFSVKIQCQDGHGSPGRASIILPPNYPPHGGSCTITPDNITVLEDLVTVKCTGWKDDDGGDETTLFYEVKVQHDAQSYLLYYGTHEMLSLFLAPASGTNTALLIVSVLDQSGARTEATRKCVTCNNYNSF